MRRIGRNARCPCGSGEKFKRCCGATQDGVARLERQEEVLEELLALPYLFPQLRPESDELTAWLDEVVAEERDASVEDAVARVPPAERERIERAHARAFPAVWRGMCEELRSEELAAEAVVLGAVLAAVGERQRPESLALRLLEHGASRDPADTLAVTLTAGDLWSVHESAQLAGALDALPEDLDDEAYAAACDELAATTAARLTTRWHERRLALLVRRLSAQLPFAGFRDASAAIATACAAFAVDEALGPRLAELLLVDSLERLEQAEAIEALRPAA